MRLLLDTHTLLWFLNGSSRLSVPAREAICDLTNHRFVSTASLWEVAIKTSLGKLTLATSFEEMIEKEIDLNDINVLPIEGHHLITMAKLAFPANDHRDPFDRMIVAQAARNNLALVTRDTAIREYASLQTIVA